MASRSVECQPDRQLSASAYSLAIEWSIDPLRWNQAFTASKITLNVQNYLMGGENVPSACQCAHN